jgi:YkoY family integral membrane protein
MQTILEYLDLTSFQASDLLVVATLVVLEGLLSCDNAVALAILVRRLPKEQQGKALRYGIVGAYAFLIIAMCLATWIISQWYLKVLGGLYLVWIACGHFLRRKADALAADAPPRPLRPILGLSVFWSAVVMVEATDIAFSVDSIAAAVALSSKLWVLITAGMIYILIMRFAAQGFVILLHRFPHLETAAFLAVLTIGLKLLVEIPSDVIGLRTQLPATAAYTTATEYEAAVLTHRPPLLTIPHVLAIHPPSASAPDESRFADPREYRKAKSFWNLEARPLMHLDHVGSSVLILLLFALGFIKRAKPEE